MRDQREDLWKILFYRYLQENIARIFCQHQSLHYQIQSQIAIDADFGLEKNVDQHDLEYFLRQNVSSQDLQIWRDELEESLRVDNLHYCCWGDEDYPSGFRHLKVPPFLFSYIGEPFWQVWPIVAVVGARELSRAGSVWMDQELRIFLSSLSVATASGGARGVDQKTHELSLLSARPTGVILPAGLGQIYPQSIQVYCKKIIAGGGAILTEYPFRQPLAKHHFLARNRLIAALGYCTLIVQASERSGTLITARAAIELSRSVLVVPSHPLQTDHLGGLKLIMEGATPVLDARDLINIFASESRCL